MAVICDVRHFLALTFLAVALAVSGSMDVQAQARPDNSREQQIRQPNSGNGGMGLPSWAEPSNSSTGSDFGSSGGAITNAPAPGPGDEPNRVPVDGGLSLLALAGAGYAVRKLRSRDDESDESRDDAV
jgi:hypothetical protein